MLPVRQHVVFRTTNRASMHFVSTVCLSKSRVIILLERNHSIFILNRLLMYILSMHTCTGVGTNFWFVHLVVIYVYAAQIMIIDSHCKYLESSWIFDTTFYLYFQGVNSATELSLGICMHPRFGHIFAFILNLHLDYFFQ